VPGAAAGSAAASGTTREAGGGPLAQLAAGVIGGATAGASALPKREAYSETEIRGKSNLAYRKAEAAGGAIKPDYFGNILDELDSSLPQDRASKILEGDRPARTIIKDIRQLTDKPISLEEAQSIDRIIGDKITKFILPNGKPDADGKQLMSVRDAFRDAITNAKDDALIGGKKGFNEWNKARELWSKSLKLGDVEHILSRAEGRDNPVTIIRNGFAAIRDNRKKFASYSKDEKAAIRKAASTGIVSELLRIPGSRLVPIASLATGSPSGALTNYATGIAARSARDALQAKRALGVAEAIAGRKPRDLTSPLLGISLGTMQGIKK
jgi:hypothetical protein